MPEKDIAVSIIIPVHSASDKLSRCLSSISAQTLKNTEIILVSDVADAAIRQICDDFARDNSNSKAIYLERARLGEMCNRGFEASAGRYIGFVLPSDWVEDRMYEELYLQAIKHGVDAVKTLVYLEKGRNSSEIKNIGLHPHSFDEKITDKRIIQGLYLKDSCFWSSIYSRDFLNRYKIRFNETDCSPEYHAGFAFKVSCHAGSLFVCRYALYHHVAADTGFAQTDAALSVLDEHKSINQYINNEKPGTYIMQAEAAKAYYDINRQYSENCTNLEQRTSYLTSASPILKSYLEYIGNNPYLTKPDKDKFKNLAEHPASLAFFDKRNTHVRFFRAFLNVQFQKKVTHIKLLGFPLLFIKNTPEYKTFNICGMPIKRSKKSIKHNGTVKTVYYYFYLPLKKRIENKEEIKTYILGIRAHKEINIQAQLSDIRATLGNLPTSADIFAYASLANTVAAVHMKIFPQFKNCNTGKCVAVFGSGPTLNFAPEIKDVVTIACNRTYEFFGDNDPDYIFVQDYPAVRIYLDNILEKRSKIFIGRITFKSLRKINTPEHLRNKENIYKYFASSVKGYDQLMPELESNVLANFGTIVNAAVHFALYTNPDIIYLIGCDTSNSGYASKNAMQHKMNTSRIRSGYEKLKEFRDIHYPNVRIISINPIGLRGLFEDTYTTAFVHQSHDIDLSKIKILDSI